MPGNILSAIRKRAKKLLIGGDDAQSIYESGSRVEKIESILQPNRIKLSIVHRLTRKIVNVVRNILPDNNIVAGISGRMEEVQVTLAHADSLELELAWVWHQAKRFAETRHPSVVVLPEHKAIKNFMRFVAEQEGWHAPEFTTDSWKNDNYSDVNQKFSEDSASICLQYLGNGYGSLVASDSQPIVYVMSYHSIKGLEFKTVFLPLLTSSTLFWHESDIARRLFFVGVTRSYSNLFMSYHGKEPHLYVQELPQEELHKIEIGPSHEHDDNEDVIF